MDEGCSKILFSPLFHTVGKTQQHNSHLGEGGGVYFLIWAR